MTEIRDREYDDQGWTEGELHPWAVTAGYRLQAQPTSGGLTIRVGKVGPRGGWQGKFGGDLDELRVLLWLVQQSLDFGAEVEVERQRWLARSDPAGRLVDLPPVGPDERES